MALSEPIARPAGADRERVRNPYSLLPNWLYRRGKHFDDALMHRVAEATVKELAESIAERLVAEYSDGLVGID